MEFVSDYKSIPKLIFHSGGIPRRSLGKTFGNYLTTGTDSIAGIFESKSLTLTIWYKQPLEIILQASKKDMIRPLEI